MVAQQLVTVPYGVSHDLFLLSPQGCEPMQSFTHLLLSQSIYQTSLEDTGVGGGGVGGLVGGGVRGRVGGGVGLLVGCSEGGGVGFFVGDTVGDEYPDADDVVLEDTETDVVVP